MKPAKPVVPVVLADRFDLPEDRPRTQRRIPHAKNYPQVVAALFAACFDAAGGRLRRGLFGFADVQAAITATGANLPWTRADTFVQELARSRNVRKLLAPCLAHGFTIRPVAGDHIGEFVREGEPGDITDKQAIEIKSRDLAGAIPLGIRLAASRLPDLLQDARVSELLWGGDAHRVGHCLVVADLGNLPPKSRLLRTARVNGMTEVILIARVTVNHVAVVRFIDCLESAKERCRHVFRVEIAEKVEATLFGDVVLQPMGRRRRKPIP